MGERGGSEAREGLVEKQVVLWEEWRAMAGVCRGAQLLKALIQAVLWLFPEHFSWA